MRLRFHRRQLLDAIPDAPPFLETRAMLLGGGRILGDNPDNCVVWRHRLMTLVDKAAPEIIASAISAIPSIAAVQVDLAQAHMVAAALPAWQMSRAQRLVQAENRRVPTPAGARIGLFPSGAAPTGNFPSAIRRCITESAPVGRVAAVWIGSEIVSVCYCGWETESLCDLAVFTDPRHRRRGYAAAAAFHLIGHMQTAGKRACWLAEDRNTASSDLARKLGFRASDQTAVFRNQFS